MDARLHAAVSTDKLKGEYRMKKYEKPEFEITKLAGNDVITDSAYDNDAKDADWMNIDDIDTIFG